MTVCPQLDLGPNLLTLVLGAWFQIAHTRVAVTVGCIAGCDVLWGGCPMITLPLERMASRVAASLCYATGLGHEMVVNSQQASSSSVPSDCLHAHLVAPVLEDL